VVVVGGGGGGGDFNENDTVIPHEVIQHVTIISKY
jgi:hypothetical protein